MRKDDEIALRHMLEGARQALDFAGNETRASLDSDRKLEFALVKAIEIVGEAACKVSANCCETLPQIPWSNIIGMRNRLIHAYFDINLDILWKTITEDLPPLIAELEKILESE
jgi:uncharacterized protein with HEPN domain